MTRTAPNGGRVSSSRIRTPIIMQLEAADCGAACLGIVLAHFGRRVPLEELRESCDVGRDGASALDIVRGAARHGLKATGWRREVHELWGMKLPLILFWGFNHFVVLEGMGRNRFYLNDPATGHRVVDRDTFDRDFTGVALTFSVREDFTPGGESRGVFTKLWPWLRDYRSSLAFAAFCGFLLALPILTLPLALTVFVDQVLVAGQTGWGVPIVAAVAAAGALIYLLTWLQARALRRVAVRLSTDQSDRYITRLMRLPMRFFAQRYAGDLASRMQLINQVAKVGAEQLVGLTIELLMSILFLAIMVAYDWRLSLVILILAAACLLLMRVMIRLRRDQSHKLRRHQGLLQGIATAGVRLIENLRATSLEDDFFKRLGGLQATELQARQEFAELGHAGAAIPSMIQVFSAAAVFGLGGWQVMRGDMTIGMLMGFHVLASQFLLPVGRFAQFLDLLETLEADLHRLDDVLQASEDVGVKALESGKSRSVVTLGGRLRLVGRLEMRNITFGFQRNQPPLIENFSLVIEPGQRIAVIGPSASGKSTLALIASGIHEPWSGEVLFDGQPRKEIPREVLTASVSMIDQQITLFDATVRENLTLWNPQTPDEHLIAAAQDASIHEEIIARPLGYDSKVEEGGRNFSGGQRQRLEIARSLVANPSLLILDEATSALDPVTELRIDRSIRRRNCSCLVIAHRLSTIRDADQILILGRGELVEHGTHDELAAIDDSEYRKFLHGQ